MSRLQLPSSKTSTQNIEWWLSHLRGATKTSTGWVAFCPAHDDRNQSLSLTESSGEVLVHCFAGCEYSSILQALEDPRSSPAPKAPLTAVGLVGSSDQTASWWEEYTGVPRGEWQSWGVQFQGSQVRFTWKSSKSVKSRQQGTKEFSWSGPSSPPPLWPEVPDSLPREIWFSEGESDLGVLRHLGFVAFSVTKGAGSRLSPSVWEILKSRGVQEVILVFDDDLPGREGAQKYIEDARAASLEARALHLGVLLDPLLGEKDLRDLYRRLGESLQGSLQSLLRVSRLESRAQASRKVSLEEFLATPISEAAWTVKDIWLHQSTGIISGPPKSGKSWVALDLGLSVATGAPFLGKFEVKNPGPVVLITSEDPDPLLQDRLQKILLAKGLGGKIQLPTVTFPQALPTPFYLDLARTFTFSNEGNQELFVWLDKIVAERGKLSLVIFDPVLRFLPPGLDEFKVSEVASAIFLTTSLIYGRYGAGVILIHHKNKSHTEGKGSYGSVAFGAFSESALYLTPTEEGSSQWVSVLGEYKSSAQTHWAYRFAELESEYVIEVSSGE